MDGEAYDALAEARGRAIPMGRVAQPGDVAVGAAVFLASDQSMYLTGASIPVDGPLTS